MINLIPPRAKKVLLTEYRLRVLSVVMLVVSAASLVALALSVPTSILLARQTQSFINNGDLTREIGEERKRITEELSKTRSLIDHLSRTVKITPYSKIISDLDSLAGSGVSIDQFAFDNRSKLVITGVASTRTELSFFRDRLEERKDFRTIELPLSSLVKDADLPFSITITLN